MMRLATAPAGARTLGSTVSLADRLPDPMELDALWRMARASMAAASVRDARYLRWRYGSQEGEGYGFVTVHKRSALTGLAVVRRPRSNGDPRRHSGS